MVVLNVVNIDDAEGAVGLGAGMIEVKVQVKGETGAVDRMRRVSGPVPSSS
jgi:hypothetical protein